MSRKRNRHERNGTPGLPETPEAQTAAEEAQVEEAATPPEEAEVSPAPETIVLTHEPSGEVCRIANHSDGHGHCQRCRHCRVKIRPQHMDEPCPARA
jgi:hypothetical protein